MLKLADSWPKTLNQLKIMTPSAPYQNVRLYKSIRSILNKITFKFTESRGEQQKFKTMKIFGHITCKKYRNIDDDTRIPSNVRIFDISLDFQLLNYDTRFAFWTLLNKMVHIMCCILWGIFRKNLSRKMFYRKHWISPTLIKI